MNYQIKITILTGLLSLSTSISAAVFDFTPTAFGVTNEQAYESVGMIVDGIKVDVTAYTVANDDHGNIISQTQVTGSHLGVNLGVYVSSSNNLGMQIRSSDSAHLDGGNVGSRYDLDEGLMFTFDQLVSLDYVNFDNFGPSDDFHLTIDGSLVLADFGRESISPFASLIAGQREEFDFRHLTGREFFFWADGQTDEFRINAFNVSAVPEPSSLFLFGTGLAILAGMRLNRKKNKLKVTF